MTRNLCPGCREQDNDKGCTKIVGAAQCPYCGCGRSNLGCDSRVSCVLCGKVTSQVPGNFSRLPEEIRKVVLELVSTDGDLSRPYLTVTHIDDSQASFDDHRGRQALQEDVDCFAIDNTRVVLTNGPFESLTLTYSSNDLDAFRKATSGGRKPVPLREVPSHFPKALADAIAKLTAYGFSYCGDGHTNFKFGNRFAGLNATVSFIP